MMSHALFLHAPEAFSVFLGHERILNNVKSLSTEIKQITRFMDHTQQDVFITPTVLG